MRAVAVIVASLAVAACGGGTRSTIPAGDICEATVEAACDREIRCGRYADRAQCVADLTDRFDACPLTVQAIALQEVGYDDAAAARFIDALRAGSCDDQSIPDPSDDIPVFTPLLGAGAVCHSDASCTAGLVCEDITIANPQGVCTANTGV